MILIIMMVLFNTCKSSKNTYHPRKYNTTKCPGYSSGYYWDRN